MTDRRDDLLLVYDGQCPFCNAYSNRLRLRAAAGNLRLIDARDGGPEMDRITAQGIDVDDGMVLFAGGEMFYGSDAIHALALLSSHSGLFNRINFLIFRSPRMSRLLYPVLRACRNLALKILRRSRINNLDMPENDRY